MKSILKITIGVALGIMLFGFACTAMFAASAPQIEKEMNETRDRHDQQEREYWACAEKLDIMDPEYGSKLNLCSEGLYR